MPPFPDLIAQQVMRCVSDRSGTPQRSEEYSG